MAQGPLEIVGERHGGPLELEEVHVAELFDGLDQVTEMLYFTKAM